MARLDAANARIGARRTRIAGPQALRALLARGPEAAPEEAALRDAFVRERAQVLGWVEGRRARALLGAWLALDEAIAVKAVLRGVAAGEPVDRILAAAPPSPGLGAAALLRAAAAPSVEAAALALAAAPSDLGAAAQAALGLAAPQEGLAGVELAVDRAAVTRARAACRRRGEDGRVMAHALAGLADVRNASTLLVLAGAVPRASPWIPGGPRLAPERLEALARRGAEAARAAVAAVWRVPAAALASPARAERTLESALVRALGREARLRPLSLAVPLAYLAARREEVRRTALVIRGAAVGLDPDELLDLVEA
jgi:V/A-type H+-transporting ATPase subunit C